MVSRTENVFVCRVRGICADYELFFLQRAAFSRGNVIVLWTRLSAESFTTSPQSNALVLSTARKKSRVMHWHCYDQRLPFVVLLGITIVIASEAFQRTADTISACSRNSERCCAELDYFRNACHREFRVTGNPRTTSPQRRNPWFPTSDCWEFEHQPISAFHTAPFHSSSGSELSL